MPWKQRCLSNWNVADTNPLMSAPGMDWRWISLRMLPENRLNLSKSVLTLPTPPHGNERYGRFLLQQWIERFEKVGAEPATGSPEQFAKLYRDEHENWKAVIKRANIKVN